MSDAISSQLENIITMLIAISIASERLVEIIGDGANLLI